MHHPCLIESCLTHAHMIPPSSSFLLLFYASSHPLPAHVILFGSAHLALLEEHAEIVVELSRAKLRLVSNLHQAYKRARHEDSAPKQISAATAVSDTGTPFGKPVAS